LRCSRCDFAGPRQAPGEKTQNRAGLTLLQPPNTPARSQLLPGPTPTSFSLAAPDGRLVRVAPGGAVDARGAAGGEGATLFHALPAGGAGGGVLLATRAAAGDAGCAYLAVGAAPGLAVAAVPAPDRATPLRLAPAKAAGGGAAGARRPGAPPPPAWPAAPPLTAEQREAFKRDGYLVVRGAAGPLAVEAALRVLNSAVGALAAGPAASEDARKELLRTEHPAALGLCMRTRVGGVAAQLCGKLAPPRRAQLAPRYPQPLPAAAAARAFAAAAAGEEEGGGGGSDPLACLGEDRGQGPPSRWHVDGMNPEPPAKGVAGFSLLVGVALSDTPFEGAGQFTVFPGSHLELSTLIAAQGEGALAAGAGGGARPPLTAQPLELRLAAGDAVFAHPLLAHRVGVNFSARIRAAVFFRLSHVDHEKLRPALLAGAPWAELLGEQGA
jgi:hypothetical protein